MSTTKCQICSIGDAKYKCSACKTPTCCLTCSKTHQADCTARNSVDPQSQDGGISKDAPEQHSSSSLNHSVQTSDIQALFEQYPSLRGKLKKVYDAIQGPNESAEMVPDRSRAWSSNQNWKPEQGARAGLQALNGALQAENLDPSGMHAFMNLLTKTTSRS